MMQALNLHHILSNNNIRADRKKTLTAKYIGGILDDITLADRMRALGFTAEACAVISQIRNSNPSRRVQSNGTNVTGRYPSRKMQVTISFESHKIEAPIIHQLEHDDCIDEYYDQPPPIKLEYVGSDGKRRSHFHTPDFFVIGTERGGLARMQI